MINSAHCAVPARRPRGAGGSASLFETKRRNALRLLRPTGSPPAWEDEAAAPQPTLRRLSPLQCVADSPAILMGRIFDDRGNRMTPSHSNKAGVRYRYYVSHALLQRRKDEAGGVARVPAGQVEAAGVEAGRPKLMEKTPDRRHRHVS